MAETVETLVTREWVQLAPAQCEVQSVNVETGAIDESVQRYGGQIVQLIMDGFEDVFINEGMARDTTADK